MEGYNYELELVYLSPYELKPYENNTRKHTPDDIEGIKTSIRNVGFNDPIGIWGDENLIVEGHGRQIAAIEMGLEKVPCIRLDHLTEEQRKEYAIRHNRSAELSEWDFSKLEKELAELQLQGIDMSDLGFDADDFDQDGTTDEAQEDNFEPEIPEEPRTQRGQIIQLGKHRLMCGDSTQLEDVEALMDGAKADLLLTDPPYNVALGQNMTPEEARVLHRRTDGLVINNDAWATEEGFIEFLRTCLSNGMSAMKNGAAFYIWYASNQALNFLRAAEKAGMEIRQTLVWNKSTFAFGRQDYQWKHEPCLYGWKSGAAHYFVDIRNITTVMEDGVPEISKMKKEEMARLLEEIFADRVPTTVINEEKPKRSELHPTMKPIKLLAHQIQNSSKRGWKVLDLFGGSGSTMIACEQLNRSCYMMELDPHYCDVIIDRWEEFTGKTATVLKG